MSILRAAKHLSKLRIDQEEEKISFNLEQVPQSAKHMAYIIYKLIYSLHTHKNYVIAILQQNAMYVVFITIIMRERVFLFLSQHFPLSVVESCRATSIVSVVSLPIYAYNKTRTPEQRVRRRQ